jgi:two-component system, NtrC family, C4-dicarboxylate transport sensor histidine kinase DctB
MRLRDIRLWQIGALFALFALGLVVLIVSERLATQLVLKEEGRRAQASVILLESSFRRELEKFRMASFVLARDPDAAAALANRDESARAFLNSKLEALSKDMQAASIYVLDDTGVAVASSNWREPTSFVGKSYGFRAYFQQAMSSGSHEQFALGNVSRRPGLYISRKIEINANRTGVVVIKVEFDQLEAEWKGYGKPAFVTNPQGIILVTSRSDWRFLTTTPLSPAQKQAARSTRDFGDGPLKQVDIYASNNVGTASQSSAKVPRYLEATKQPSPSWTVHVLSDTQAIVARAIETTRLLVFGALLLIVAIVAIDVYRRRSIVARADLAAAERIRDLNERLTHANKLSVLGQIAAGVAHEINQPLAAIGTFAASGVALVDRGATDQARENLTRIGTLTNRIGIITGELRSFARKAPRSLEPIDLGSCIKSAISLLEERARELHVRISTTDTQTDCKSLAPQGAIEQVLVNLLQNALDASPGESVIQVSLKQEGAMNVIAVTDQGNGLSSQAMATLFQPFATSKAEGLGLGLVISRDLLREFGGELSGVNAEKGCVFTVRLPIASKDDMS